MLFVSFIRTSKKAVNRELHYGDTPRSSSRSRTIERTDREAMKRDVQYTSEGKYDKSKFYVIA